jgi:hypothetical protein
MFNLQRIAAVVASCNKREVNSGHVVKQPEKHSHAKNAKLAKRDKNAIVSHYFQVFLCVLGVLERILLLAG